MSGGTWDYLYARIEDGSHDMQAWDVELADLMRDLSEVCRECELADSGDANAKAAREEIEAFKGKWFRGDRRERLRGYIDQEIEDTRARLARMIRETE